MTIKTFLSAKGSASDPGLDGVRIDGKPYQEHFTEGGITVLESVVESCHRTRDLMDTYSIYLQHLANRGDRMFGGYSGGILFAMPSLQATWVSIPLVIAPNDFTAYQGFVIPGGNAVVAGVGVERIVDSEGSGTLQRAKLLRLAEKVLNLESDKVNVLTNYGKAAEEIRKQLDEFKIGVNTQFDPNSLSLVYAHNDFDGVVNDKGNYNHAFIWADPNFNPCNWDSMKNSEERHHNLMYNFAPNAQVYCHQTPKSLGAKSLAIYAAKCISLQRSDVRERVMGLKTESPVGRDLVAEVDKAAAEMRR